MNRLRRSLSICAASCSSTLALIVACSHPQTGGSGAGGNGTVSGGGDSTSGGLGTGGNTGGSGVSTAGSGVTMGGSVTVLGGNGGAPVQGPAMACAADPMQRQALPYTPGYQIGATEKTNAANATQTLDYAARIRQMAGPNNTGYDDIFRTADDSGIKGFEFRDGPRGVNLDPVKGSGKGYTTSFPAPSSRGATFDVDLEHAIGVAMGDELIASGSTMLLAPTVNILRHPGWGRAQETYGEDSFLLGRLGTAFTVGVQEFAPACVKHYAANNIEKGRDALIAKMDEQTLQEVYARHFGMIVQDGGAACVMAAYNLVQTTGTAQKSTQNHHLLTDILRGEYGFQGMVLSDWWAMPGGQNPDPNTRANSAKEAVKAGLDMELPWKLNFPELASQQDAQADVGVSAGRVLETKFRFHVNDPNGQLGLKAPTTKFDKGSYSITGNEAHAALAEKAALEGTVLLKNDMNVLPIAATVKKVAVVGPQVAWELKGVQASGTINFASDARLGDLGSSRVNADPGKSISPCAGFKAQAPAGVEVVCGDGAAGMTAAQGADFVVVVAGLTPHDEGEEYTITPDDSDRGANLGLDGKTGGTAQNDYIKSIAALGKPTVVVLEGGSVIDVSSFVDQVKGLVMAWYPGQSGGNALAKLMFGVDKATGTKVSFSGKLPVTWPKALADEPPFSGNGGNAQTTQMDYYLGYRWFDTQGKTPLYPFGHGLSYTTFEYSNLYVPCTTVPAGGVVKIEVDVKNTGAIDADEVVFAFVTYPGSTVPKRVMGYKELRGFQRAHVPAGAAVRVTIPIRVSDLWYWDTANNKQAVAPGEVKVLVGGSSAQLPLMGSFTVM
ncbi:MAG TPA: glycoside hydrolase family 3 C-terminal domain-containing protein [Polyangiaceae bacterium]|nr:glycoside hydrolase family 3 C-terminal domain-containing protein [Polyangiaceae bacterium]